MIELSDCAKELINRTNPKTSSDNFWNAIRRTSVAFRERTAAEEDEEEREANRNAEEKILSILTTSIVDGKLHSEMDTNVNECVINEDDFGSDDPVALHGILDEEEKLHYAGVGEDVGESRGTVNKRNHQSL